MPTDIQTYNCRLQLDKIVRIHFGRGKNVKKKKIFECAVGALVKQKCFECCYVNTIAFYCRVYAFVYNAWDFNSIDEKKNLSCLHLFRPN